MAIGRRKFLAGTGLALAAGAVGSSSGMREPARRRRAGDAHASAERWTGNWDTVRGQFALDERFVQMSALLIASHPQSVRAAIDAHRHALDANPVTYLEDNNRRLRDKARKAAGAYLGLDADEIALTDSTTMGIGLVYNGLRLAPGDEILSTEQDYYVTHEALRLAAERTGTKVRKVSLHDGADSVSAEQIVRRIADAITPRTRVLAVTWVHSSTGLKLPLARIAAALERVNADRDEDKRVLFCVDGVHGFGCEDADFAALGCDFFMAGCHKWLFGPRGTGIVAARKSAWKSVLPTIPSFIDDEAWEAWMSREEPDAATDADSMTPGGFKAFEHQWAMTEAFEFHRGIGKARIAERTHALASQLKEGLAGMRHVSLHTPRSPELSAGIVAFDLEGMSARSAVEKLRERRVIATVTPYARRHVRLTPSIRNTPAEIDTALREVHALTA